MNSTTNNNIDYVDIACRAAGLGLHYGGTIAVMCGIANVAFGTLILITPFSYDDYPRCTQPGGLIHTAKGFVTNGLVAVGASALAFHCLSKLNAK
ncbi:MAG: hypothetical protein V4489_01705 [Chlamydiota bacterium]